MYALEYVCLSKFYIYRPAGPEAAGPGQRPALLQAANERLLALFDARAARPMRLDQVTCCALGVNKREALRLIHAGLVHVSPLGTCPRDPSFQVVLGAETVARRLPDVVAETSDDRAGQPSSNSGDAVRETTAPSRPQARKPPPQPFHRLLVVHKPAGYVSERARTSASWIRANGGAKRGRRAREDHTHGAPSVYELIPARLSHPKLGAYGRLDKGTTGLLLVGTDGGLGALLTHPASSLDGGHDPAAAG